MTDFDNLTKLIGFSTSHNTTNEIEEYSKTLDFSEKISNDLLDLWNNYNDQEQNFHAFEFENYANQYNINEDYDLTQLLEKIRDARCMEIEN